MKSIEPTGAGVALSTYSSIFPHRRQYDEYFLYKSGRTKSFKQIYKSLKPSSHIVYYTACCMEDYLSPASLFLDPDKTGVLIDTMKQGALTRDLQECESYLPYILCGTKYDYNHMYRSFLDSYKKFLPRSFEISRDTDRLFVCLLETTKLELLSNENYYTSVQLYLDEHGNVYLYFSTIIDRVSMRIGNVSDILMVFNYKEGMFTIFADRDHNLDEDHIKDVIQIGLGVTKDKLQGKRAEDFILNKTSKRITNRLGHMVFWPYLYSVLEKENSVYDFGPFMQDFQVTSLVASSIEGILEDFEDNLDWKNGFTVSGFPNGYKLHPPDSSLNDLTDSFRSIIKIKYTMRTH